LKAQKIYQKAIQGTNTVGALVNTCPASQELAKETENGHHHDQHYYKPQGLEGFTLNRIDAARHKIIDLFLIPGIEAIGMAAVLRFISHGVSRGRCKD
jgi:hypothetical protein